MNRVSPVQNENGIALVVAIVGLAVMGALVTAAFVPTILERRLADNSRRAWESFSAAEFGLEETIANWNTGQWNVLSVSDTVTVGGTLPGGIGTYAGSVRRLNPDLFLVDVVGKDHGGQTRQQLGQLVKLQLLDMDIQAALTTRGPTKIGGSAEVDGNDNPPAGWSSCGVPDSTMAGIRMQDTDDLSTAGSYCNNLDCVDGNPALEEDPTMSDSTFFVYGDVTWDDLVAMSNLIMPPGTHKIESSIAGNLCATYDLRNWGDPLTPTSPCFGHMPIIYSPGDLTINGNYGQGILLVEGDLSVQGGFEFYGITIVKGQLKTTGTGGHFNGAVLAPNVHLDDITVLGDALVQFSSCAVQRALAAASPATPLRSRGWLYAF